jgi:hypothetical protein
MSARYESAGDACACIAVVAAALLGLWLLATWVAEMPMPR